MSTIFENFRMPSVAGYASKHGETKSVPMPDWLVGIELEIESFPRPFHEDLSFGGVRFTEDGSLRNGGIEAITKPLYIKHVKNLLTAFFTKFTITDANYSERCSTHVHFNVQSITIEQLTTICLVYQTVEKLLFEFVGHERNNNIFCVPWMQSNINYNIVNKMKGGSSIAFRQWQKYSALNLIPVTTQGTIEFRHLFGTCNTDKICNWIYILAKIFEYALKTDIEDAKTQIVNMNTVSNYRQWLVMVFGDYADKFASYPGFERDLSVGVIESKLMLIQDAGITYDEPPEVAGDPGDYDEDVEELRFNLAPAPAINAPRAQAIQLAPVAAEPELVLPRIRRRTPLAPRFDPAPTINWEEVVRQEVRRRAAIDPLAPTAVNNNEGSF